MKYQSINLSKKVFQKSVFKCENSEKQFHHFEVEKSSSSRSTTLPLCAGRNYFAKVKSSKNSLEIVDSENLILLFVSDQTFQKIRSYERVIRTFVKSKDSKNCHAATPQCRLVAKSKNSLTLNRIFKKYPPIEWAWNTYYLYA